MKKYEIEYRDCTGMRCGEEIEAVSEKEAIKHCQQTLLLEGDYMTELLSIDEVNCSCDDCDGEWKLKDGTVLEPKYQDALNEAMGSYTNENGLTLEEAIKRASARKNNK